MKKLKIILPVLVVLIFLLFNALFVVRKDEFKVVKEFGKITRIVDQPGLYFKVPFIDSTQSIPNNMLIYDLPVSDVITKDKKTMVADSFVLWRITDAKKFIKTLDGQTQTAEARINTLVYNSMKNVISSMSQTDVISGRTGALAQAIKGNLGNVFEQYGIELIAVETKHLDLPSDNKEAVYERMISERNNIAAQYTAEGEAEAKNIRTETDTQIEISISEANAAADKTIAEGEAEYMKILSKAYNDKEKADFYSFVRALDAAKKTMNSENKTLILDKESPLTQIFINGAGAE